MFIDKNGNLYDGDMQPGDREATTAEIAAFEDSQIPGIKWDTYAEYCNALTVTTTAGHKFSADPEALKNVAFKHSALLEGVSILWVEDGGPFNTDRVELQEVSVRASGLMQDKIIELFGGV